MDGTYVVTEVEINSSAKPPSPFLPGTTIQYALDSTSLGYMKTCPRLYQYIMLEGYQSRGESIHLRFGLEYHQALQEYDVSRANGVKHEDAIHDVVRELIRRVWDWKPNGKDKDIKYKNRDTLVSLVVDYLDHFSNDPAETYIQANGKPAVELSFRFELDWGPRAAEVTDINDSNEQYTYGQPYLLCGHLDRVVNFNDSILVMDRKTTTTTLGSYYFDQYEPHNQMSLYTLAGKVVLDAPIRGVIIDAAQVMLDAPNRFVRGFTYRTPDQTQEWLFDLRVLLETYEHYANINYWPMNDTSCDKFGGCRFRGICSKDPAVRERLLKADFVKLPELERWNPLKPR